MTIEEAKEHIRWLSVFAHNKEDRDAIKMAINSLSVIEDIKAEIKEEADGSVGEIGDGYYDALEIIDKHISGKDQE